MVKESTLAGMVPTIPPLQPFLAPANPVIDKEDEFIMEVRLPLHGCLMAHFSSCVSLLLATSVLLVLLVVAAKLARLRFSG